MLILLTLCIRSRNILEGRGEGVLASHLLGNLNKVENLFPERTIVVFFCSRIQLHEQYYESLTGKKFLLKEGNPVQL